MIRLREDFVTGDFCCGVDGGCFRPVAACRCPGRSAKCVDCGGPVPFVGVRCVLCAEDHDPSEWEGVGTDWDAERKTEIENDDAA